MQKLGLNPNFRLQHYGGGIGVLLLLALFYVLPLKQVFSLVGEYDWQSLWQDQYVHQVIRFSFSQAFLSASLSLIFGIILARAFFYQKMWGKNLILRLFSLTFVLPSLVAIFGLLGIYGNSGWLSQLAQFFGLAWRPNIYGLTGILVAHLFFNIPLATRIFLQSLQRIPNQQRQLAAQLNVRGWQFIRLIELPYLRQELLSSFALIFMLCFTSFAIVLTLGGGPKYTSLEVAIYQAILFEFDLPKAALFALLQFFCCFLLFHLSSLFHRPTATTLSTGKIWFDQQTSAVKFWQILLLSLTSVFILLPLLHILYAALSSGKWLAVWQMPQLWQALAYSLTIAPLSACVALLLSVLLLLLARRLQWLAWHKTAQFILTLGATILAIPTLVLALGLFLLLQNLDFSTVHLFLIVVCCNGLAAMPFVLRILSEPMYNNMIYYEKLCQSLHIQGWQRFRLIEWQQLKTPIQYAFALACCLSLGDFTAIALFGNQQFTSLPHLLYQQLGQYRSSDAAVTALILLLFCALIFLFLERTQSKQKTK